MLQQSTGRHLFVISYVSVLFCFILVYSGLFFNIYAGKERVRQRKNPSHGDDRVEDVYVVC